MRLPSLVAQTKPVRASAVTSPPCPRSSPLHLLLSSSRCDPLFPIPSPHRMQGVTETANMRCVDPTPERLAVFASFGVAAQEGGSQALAGWADVVFLAVKPQYVVPVVREMTPHLKEGCTLVSIAAGVTVAQIETAATDAGAAKAPAVVRVMPNTPCLVGEMAGALCLGTNAGSEDEADVTTLLSAVGRVSTCPEALLGAVTGLSGSGPAYVFLVIEALADGGVRAGLPRDMALQLAAQTVLGGAKMVLETGRHPGALKDMVTSPGGTTITGYAELEKGGVRASLINAVLAASRRADEMAQE